ncbi:MAG: multicopper oxidase domain-containing protein [Ilumatobacteraceae bacterium]
MARQDRNVLVWLGFVVAACALFISFFAMRDRGASAADGGGGGGPVAAAAASVTVGMSEFKFAPTMVMAPTDSVLHVVNNGTAAHSFEIAENGRTTGDIQPGQSKDLSLSGVSDGTYTMICRIAGHAAAGMTGSLMVGGTASADSSSGDASATESTMSWQEMDAVMAKVAKEFPAHTAGHGGDELAPTVLADGTKEFDLTSEIVKWEVSPGKLVDAWTYNGVVPAPTIHVQTGDKVKIVLTNKLPESTVIHFHGIKVPNAMDGVDPYTQDPVQPGQSFTYEFTAQGPAVGIYHSHHDAQTQVPNGLFGAFLIDEMPLPKVLVDQGYTKVDHHVNMVLNDSGTIGLSLNGKSFPATEAYTMRVGEVMEVSYFNEGLMSHPMHLHQPVGWIIAKDGTPLLEPTPGDTINIAPGERYTVLYKAEEVGTWAWHCHILNHAEGPQGMFGMVTALIVTP